MTIPQGGGDLEDRFDSNPDDSLNILHCIVYAHPIVNHLPNYWE
jgi:hypothetical protein